MVKAWGGAESVLAAESALARIEAVLPHDLRDRLDRILLFAPDFYTPQLLREYVDTLHEACLSRHLITFCYKREDGTESARTVRPLGLYRWTAVWTLAAWCDLRNGFRHFRLERMTELKIEPKTFTDRPGESLEDFLIHVQTSR